VATPILLTLYASTASSALSCTAVTSAPDEPATVMSEFHPPPARRVALWYTALTRADDFRGVVSVFGVSLAEATDGTPSATPNAALVLRPSTVLRRMVEFNVDLHRLLWPNL